MPGRRRSSFAQRRLCLAIRLENLTPTAPAANAKSITSVLAAGAKKGHS